MKQKIGQKWPGSGALPDFNFWKAAANSAGEKAPARKELLWVEIFQSSDLSFLTNLFYLRSLILLFLINGKAMA